MWAPFASQKPNELSLNKPMQKQAPMNKWYLARYNIWNSDRSSKHYRATGIQLFSPSETDLLIIPPGILFSCCIHFFFLFKFFFFFNQIQKRRADEIVIVNNSRLPQIQWYIAEMYWKFKLIFNIFNFRLTSTNSNFLKIIKFVWKFVNLLKLKLCLITHVYAR